MKHILLTKQNEEKNIITETMDLSFTKQLQLINMLYLNEEFQFIKELLSE